MVEYAEGRYYLVLGKFTFYFIKSDLSEVSQKIKYAWLLQCLTNKSKATLLQIHLSEKREETTPAKMNIYS